MKLLKTASWQASVQPEHALVNSCRRQMGKLKAEKLTSMCIYYFHTLSPLKMAVEGISVILSGERGVAEPTKHLYCRSGSPFACIHDQISSIWLNCFNCQLLCSAGLAIPQQIPGMTWTALGILYCYSIWWLFDCLWRYVLEAGRVYSSQAPPTGTFSLVFIIFHIFRASYVHFSAKSSSRVEVEVL